MKTFSDSRVPRHGMTYSKAISRTLLALIIGLSLTGALVAERTWTRYREQSAAATQQEKLNQSTAREANFSFRGIRETALADNRFTYRNLVSLPDRRPSFTPEPIILLDRTVKSTETGEFTVTASSDEPADEEIRSSQLTPLLRTAPIPAAAAAPGETRNGEREQDPAEGQRPAAQIRNEGDTRNRRPREERLTKAHDFNGDVRKLPRTRPTRRERRELEGPSVNPGFYVPPGGATPQTQQQEGPSSAPQLSAPAPAPTHVFEGLDRLNWGAGSPPDTNGDVGPNHYIQTVNTSIGIYRKTDGLQLAAFTFDTFMSQGNFGNLCDNHNFGDPVVLYDTFEDRWIITDFAFQLDSNNDVQGPAYQCIAASKSADPVSGGWTFYSRQISDALGDYPKFGIWPDGLYMTVNMFSFGANSTYQNARAYAFNKAQMYAGSPTVKVVTFDIGGGDFTVLPSNARLQTGTPPAGRPNLFISAQLFLNALTVYKFHVDWNNLFLSTFTGPDTPLAATSWPNAGVANAPQPGTPTLLDVLQIRAMVQNQYTNFGGTESLWVPHTVRRVDTNGAAAPRWYQVNVTGGTIAASLPQAATWDPDGNNTNHRYMPSLALDRAGNLAMGYSISNATTLFPSMMYAGRLAGDPVNTFSQTEQTFFQGTASQTGTTRWGDYSAMTLDPDGCTFWYTSEYANPLSQTFNERWLTKFGSIGAFPGCTPVGAGGTISGTVTTSVGGSPLIGATVMLGARSTTTNGSGNYSFNIPAGTYPSITASQPGFGAASAAAIVVTDGNITTQNFALTPAATSSCPTDTTQADFQTGLPTNLDLNVSPGNVLLSNVDNLDQQNATLGGFGVAIDTTTFGGQTFTPSLSGNLTKVDINLFCSSCTGTAPNLTLSVRSTAAGLPTGADLATATINGFNNGSAVFYTAVFGAPVAVTAGSEYALVIRPTAAPSAGTYALTRSGTGVLGADVYAGGDRVASADSGTTWSISLTGGVATDAGFRIYINNGYSSSGDLVSAPKDSNALNGNTAIWQTLSWSGSTPANTSIRFQVAGSNNVNGPYNFVGPDGTAGTFFTSSPVQLSPQFYNLRYLEYRAFLSTTNSAATPTLNDVTMCFNDVDCSSSTPAITPTSATVCTGSTGNTASGPAGMTSYSWGITNGTITSATNAQSITYIAGASGTVSLSLTVTAPNGCIASNSANVTVNPFPAKPTITPGGPTTFPAGGSVTLNSSSANGNQWYLNGNPIGGATSSSYVATSAGNYTVVVTTGGCSSPPSDATTVTTCAGAPVVTNVNDSGAGSLRQAIIDACAGSTITFDTGAGHAFDPATAPHTITLTSGELAISKSLTITGPGANVVNVMRSASVGTPNFRIFTINSGTPLNISGLSITGGNFGGGGAGIFIGSGATVTVSNSTVSGNTDNNFGGGGISNAGTLILTNSTVANNNGHGIRSTGTLTVTDTIVNNSVGSGIFDASVFPLIVTNSTITNNQGGTSGGGIFGSSGGSMTIVGSTVKGNSANGGAGIFSTNTLILVNTTISGNHGTSAQGGGIQSLGTATLTNCTVSGNTSVASGGGIFNGGSSLTLSNSTVTANTGSGGGGIDTVSGTVRVGNTIIAGNMPNDLIGTYNSLDFNLIGNTSGATFTGTTTHNVTGVNAQLGPLANNGGATQTHLPLPGSPAINAATDVTTLNGAIDNLVTSVAVTDGSSVPAGVGFVIQIDSEQMIVTARSGNLLTVTRAVNSTVAAGHNAGAAVNPAFDQRGAGFARKIGTPLDIGAVEVNYSITATAGSNQSAPINTTFATALQATVKESNVVQSNVPVTFTPPASGASGAFSSSATVNTNASGVATAPTFTANGTAGGPYNVVASLAGNLATANFALTNALGNQTITVNIHAPSSAVFNTSFTVAATASSGLPVSYSSGGSCTNVGATFTMTGGSGTCTVTYTQGGNGNYNAAPPLAETVNAQKANQTITFNALGNKTFGDADFPVSATASSSLTVSFKPSGQCTISTNTVHLTGAGTCTITAKQAGDPNYDAAPDVPRAFTIAQASTTTAGSSSANPSNLTQSVTFTATVSAPAGAGTPTGTLTFKDGAATISCANAGGQTLNGSGVASCQTSALTAGTHTITAVYSGDGNFLTSTGTLSPNQVVNNLPLVSFSAANYNVNESDGVVHVIVTRGGDTTVPFNVGYATSDTGASTNCAALNTSLASSACDFTPFSGTLQFAANQTTATIDIPINQDSYAEGPESFPATLSNATNGAVLVGPTTTIITINDSAPPALNAIDDNTAFVRQHYHDFLNREPDAAGLAFWVNGLNECSDPSKRPVGQTQAQCLELRRILTSSAFFLSIEFMDTGTFVRSFYVAALNRPLPPSTNAIDNMPGFTEWLRDAQAVQRGVIVGQGDWQTTLNANRLAFMQDFVMRAEFVALYPATDTPTQYINKLYSHALSRSPSATELSNALSLFSGAGTAADATARGQALLQVTQASDFISRELPRAFVQMQYFGYLRRNPSDPPDNNFNGYNFWLNKLNQFNGDFLQAEMVKAFIASAEYRRRFGP